MSDSDHTFRDGIVVGLIGYASVAVFYCAFDVLAARGALHTVNVLSQAVFRGLRDPTALEFPMPLDAPAIVAYNTLHLVLALGIGLTVATLVAFGEQNPSRRRAVRFFIVGGFVVTIAVVGVLTTPLRPVLPWWSIVVANALSTLLAGWYFVHRRPGLWHRLAVIAQ